MYFCDGKTEFSAVITHVFSVTYSINKIITCKKKYKYIGIEFNM